VWFARSGPVLVVDAARGSRCVIYAIWGLLCAKRCCLGCRYSDMVKGALFVLFEVWFTRNGPAWLVDGVRGVEGDMHPIWNWPRFTSRQQRDGRGGDYLCIWGLVGTKWRRLDCRRSERGVFVPFWVWFAGNGSVWLVDLGRGLRGPYSQHFRSGLCVTASFGSKWQDLELSNPWDCES